MSIIEVPGLEISKSLKAKLTRKPLGTYYFQYICRDVVRPLLKQMLGIVEVSCWAEWNKEEQRWEGNLNYRGKSYRWIIKEENNEKNHSWI